MATKPPSLAETEAAIKAIGERASAALSAASAALPEGFKLTPLQVQSIINETLGNADALAILAAAKADLFKLFTTMKGPVRFDAVDLA